MMTTQEIAVIEAVDEILDDVQRTVRKAILHCISASDCKAKIICLKVKLMTYVKTGADIMVKEAANMEIEKWNS